MTCSCCDQYFSDEKCCQIKLLFFSFVNKYVFTIILSIIEEAKSNLYRELAYSPPQEAFLVIAVLYDCCRENWCLGFYIKLLAGLNFRLWTTSFSPDKVEVSVVCIVHEQCMPIFLVLIFFITYFSLGNVPRNTIDHYPLTMQM